jgi:hypothetical protein
MARTPPTRTRTARPTAHKYPVSGDVKSYLIRDAPRSVLTAAMTRARSENKSLRVVLIEFLEVYGSRKKIS